MKTISFFGQSLPVDSRDLAPDIYKKRCNIFIENKIWNILFRGTWACPGKNMLNIQQMIDLERNSEVNRVNLIDVFTMCHCFLDFIMNFFDFIAKSMHTDVLAPVYFFT
ncbi:MAG: hypothetical protein FWC50_05125 [Planctomycetaceae bacterium]|nr:hypothetical protein [Planctomycetaceae bacterium]